MPKKLEEIKNFNKGTICNPDTADIPNNAASHSVNMDPISVNGKIKARKKDIAEYNHDSDDNMVADSMAIINQKLDSSKKDLIMYDYNNGSPQLKQFEDIDGVGTLNTLDGSVAGTINSSQVVNNKESHIGTGGTGSTPSRWAGYMNHEQFGYATNDIVSSSAEMSATSKFQSMHKIIQIGDYIFGIRWGGEKVYKFNTLDNSMTHSNLNHTFVYTSAICAGGGTPDKQHEDGTYLWIWDKDGHVDSSGHKHGILYKVNLSLQIIATHQVNYDGGAVHDPKAYIISSSGSQGTLDTSVPVGDLCETSNSLWIAFDKGNNLNYYNRGSAQLLSVPLSTFAVSIADWNLKTLSDSYNANPVYRGSYTSGNLQTLWEAGNDTLKGYYTETSAPEDGGTPGQITGTVVPALVTIQPHRLSLCNASDSATQVCYFVGSMDAGSGNEGSSAPYQIVKSPIHDGTLDYYVVMNQRGSNPHVWIIDESWATHRKDYLTPHPDKCWAVTTGSRSSATDTFVRKNDQLLYGCTWGLHSTYISGGGKNEHFLRSIAQNKYNLWLTYEGDYTGGGVTDHEGTSKWRQTSGQRILQAPSITKISDYNDKTCGSNNSKDKLSNIQRTSTENYNGIMTTWCTAFDDDGLVGDGNVGDVGQYNNSDFYNTIFGLYMDLESASGGVDIYDDAHIGYSPNFVTQIQTHFRKVWIRLALDATNTHSIGGGEALQSGNGLATDDYDNFYEPFFTQPVACTKGGWASANGTLHLLEGKSNASGVWAKFAGIAKPPASTFTLGSSGAPTSDATGFLYPHTMALKPTPVAKSPVNISVTTATSGLGNGFLGTHTYQYTATYEYDGYQEGPITGGSGDYNHAGTQDLRVTITVNNLDSNNQCIDTSKRISALNLYRREKVDDGEEDQWSQYRLVQKIVLDTGWALMLDPDFKSYRQITITDKYVVGATYDVNAGVSQAVTSTNVNYGISTKLYKSHYVGQCYHTAIGDRSTYIYKSLPEKFDMFDPLLDFVQLPSVPTALHAFAGRVYAFTENTMWRIDPNTLTIEDEFEGIGASSQKSVFITEYGMLFANKNNIYLHDGRKPTPLGYAILQSEYRGAYGYQEMVRDNTMTSSTIAVNTTDNSLNDSASKFLSAGWKPGDFISISGFTSSGNNGNFYISSVTASKIVLATPTVDVVTEVEGDSVTITKIKNTPIVTFNPKDLSYVVMVGRYAWCYNIPSKRWDMWDSPNFVSFAAESDSELKSAILNADGKMLVSKKTGATAGDLVHYAGDPYNDCAYAWVSKALDLGEAGRLKKFIEVKAQYWEKDPDNVNVDEKLTYKVDPDEFYAASDGTAVKDTTYKNQLKTSVNKKGNIIMVQVDDNDAAAGPKMEIDNISIVYRPTNRIS